MASWISRYCHLAVPSFLLLVLLLDRGVSLDVRNKPASQSTSPRPDSASRAIDGDINTFSHTVHDIDPWWKVDLEAVYCLRKITIVNRMTDFARRLTDAVVRAGLNSNHLRNAMIGSPVLRDQVNDQYKMIEITLNPVVTARYVSVDIPGEGKILHMAEVIVEEVIDEVVLASTAIALDGSASTQSSTFGTSWVASNAVDGAFQFHGPHCSQTSDDAYPWWKIDLLSDQCVRKITIKSRDANLTTGRLRLEGASVRAGLSSLGTDNMMCGSPVTGYQAVANNWMEFACNSPNGVITRYVSVDIPRYKQLALCDVLLTPCDLPQADYIVVTNPALISSSDDAVISVYRGPHEISADVSFGRQLRTGGTYSGLPSRSYQEFNLLSQYVARMLQLPAADGINRTGVFYFEAITYDRTIRIQTIVLPNEDSNVQIRPLQRTQTANIGESVTFEMRDMNSLNSEYRWRHDGGEIISSWDNLLSVSIDDVTADDEGIYTCFIASYENQEHLGIMRLIVRECPADTWDIPSCLNTCRRCYNGGVCDDKTGMCICAPGFSGKHCQQVHGRNVFGQNGGQRCSAETDDLHSDACRGRLFCLPDPYGCSCAAGYKDMNCSEECPEGTYGADCKQTCHCATGGTCRKDTGECSDGTCDSPYFGINCQCSIPDNSPVEVIPTSIAQRNARFFWSKPPCDVQDVTITGYIYKLTNVQSGMTLLSTSLPDTSITINGLIPYTEYSFQVAATTSQGTWSFTEGIPVRTDEAEPTAPLNVHILTADEDFITFEWTKPNPAQGIITNYDIAYWKPGHETSRQELINVGMATLLYRINDLELNVTYSIQVRAKTSVGEGPWSESVTETVVGVPGAIRNLHLTDRTDVSLTLDWDQPLDFNGPIPQYVVGYKALKKPHQPNSYIEEDVDKAPYTKDNLEPGTKYRFRVLSKNHRFRGEARNLEVYTKPLTIRKNASDSLSAAVPVVIVVGILLSACLVVAVICVLRRRRRRRRRRKRRREQARNPTDNLPTLPLSGSIMMAITNNDTESLSSDNAGSIIYERLDILPPWAARWEIEYKDLTVEDEVLGKGNFGEVRAGCMKVNDKVTKVAVKRLKAEDSKAATEDFMKEFKMMAGVEAHPNVVGLLGACIHQGILNVALEFLPNGNLLDYLRSIPGQQKGAQSKTGDASTLTISNLLKLGLDVAKGMEHLAANGIIHRDLAARNILLAEDMTAKVSDFGLSRGEDIYIQKSSTRIPLRWLAIESLTCKIFVRESDVWSFGILLWEMVTFGGTPYEEIQSMSLTQRLLDGYRMPKPENCPDEVYDLMMKCWNMSTKARPSFTELVDTLQQMNNVSDDHRSSDNADSVIYESLDILPAWAARWEIEYKDLTVEDEVLGKGNFGEVRAGCMKVNDKVTKVAVKRLKAEDSKTATEDFMNEFQTMAGVEAHPNVVGLLGACFHQGILNVALEFLPNGNLRDYLRSIRPLHQKRAQRKRGVASPLTFSNLLKLGIDVAKGMEHLAATGIIHRDLAARNILLAEDMTAKVSDFGLSRGEDIYIQKSSTRIPLRWLAIESLTCKIFVPESDVWSFGIVLWEMVTFGGTPYEGIQSRSLTQRLLNDYRMPKPENCPDEVYDLMMKCWNMTTKARPSFTELVDILQQMNNVSDGHSYTKTISSENFSVIRTAFDDN